MFLRMIRISVSLLLILWIPVASTSSKEHSSIAAPPGPSRAALRVKGLGGTDRYIRLSTSQSGFLVDPIFPPYNKNNHHEGGEQEEEEEEEVTDGSMYRQILDRLRSETLHEEDKNKIAHGLAAEHPPKQDAEDDVTRTTTQMGQHKQGASHIEEQEEAPVATEDTSQQTMDQVNQVPVQNPKELKMETRNSTSATSATATPELQPLPPATETLETEHTPKKPQPNSSSTTVEEVGSSMDHAQAKEQQQQPQQDNDDISKMVVQPNEETQVQQEEEEEKEKEEIQTLKNMVVQPNEETQVQQQQEEEEKKEEIQTLKNMQSTELEEEENVVARARDHEEDETLSQMKKKNETESLGQDETLEVSVKTSEEEKLENVNNEALHADQESNARFVLEADGTEMEGEEGEPEEQGHTKEKRGTTKDKENQEQLGTEAKPKDVITAKEVEDQGHNLEEEKTDQVDNVELEEEVSVKPQVTVEKDEETMEAMATMESQSMVPLAMTENDMDAEMDHDDETKAQGGDEPTEGANVAKEHHGISKQVESEAGNETETRVGDKGEVPTEQGIQEQILEDAGADNFVMREEDVDEEAEVNVGSSGEKSIKSEEHVVGSGTNVSLTSTTNESGVDGDEDQPPGLDIAALTKDETQQDFESTGDAEHQEDAIEKESLPIVKDALLEAEETNEIDPTSNSTLTPGMKELSGSIHIGTSKLITEPLNDQVKETETHDLQNKDQPADAGNEGQVSMHPTLLTSHTVPPSSSDSTEALKRKTETAPNPTNASEAATTKQPMPKIERAEDGSIIVGDRIIKPPQPLTSGKDETNANKEGGGLGHDLNQFLESVDPPEELDVAPGSSIQEVMVKKSTQLLSKHVGGGTRKVGRALRKVGQDVQRHVHGVLHSNRILASSKKGVGVVWKALRGSVRHVVHDIVHLVDRDEDEDEGGGLKLPPLGGAVKGVIEGASKSGDKEGDKVGIGDNNLGGDMAFNMDQIQSRLAAQRQQFKERPNTAAVKTTMDRAAKFAKLKAEEREKASTETNMTTATTSDDSGHFVKEEESKEDVLQLD